MRDKNTALIVDDEPEHLKNFKDLLKGMGFRCETAVNGKEALEEARLLKPLIVMLDLTLPDMEGTEVCRLIKEDPELSDTIVIILTDRFVSDETITKVFEAGATDCFFKTLSRMTGKVRLMNILKMQIQTEHLLRQKAELEQANLHLQKLLKEREELEEHLKLYNEKLEATIQKKVQEALEAQSRISYLDTKSTTLEQALRDKETLLKEVHHRVKNNLQIISSLLSLQMNTINDPKVLDTFKDSVNRIKSMALVHEKLYQSSDLSTLNAREYFDELITNIVQSFESNILGEIRTKLDIRVEGFDVDMMISCSLIVCELVSNAMKYAFSDGRKGEIGLYFDYKGGEYILTYWDNGIGLPPDEELKKRRSMGWQLINDLAKRKLHGRLEIDRSKGTKITITFRPVKQATTLK